jgi:sec-independent protein translocase protein TatA
VHSRGGRARQRARHEGHLMIAGLTGLHLLIIVAVIVLIFGATKLPIFAKSLGQSVKILHREVRSMQEPDPDERAAAVATPPTSETSTPSR